MASPRAVLGPAMRGGGFFNQFPANVKILCERHLNKSGGSENQDADPISAAPDEKIIQHLFDGRQAVYGASVLVYDQVQHHLLQLGLISHHRREPRRALLIDANSAGNGLTMKDGEHIVQDIADLEDCFGFRLLFHHRAHATDDPCGPVVVAYDVSEELAQFFDVAGGRLQKAQGRLGGAENGGQRLVEFVGERGRHLA